MRSKTTPAAGGAGFLLFTAGAGIGANAMFVLIVMSELTTEVLHQLHEILRANPPTDEDLRALQEECDRRGYKDPITAVLKGLCWRPSTKG
jgi:hypothetical protein